MHVTHMVSLLLGYIVELLSISEKKEIFFSVGYLAFFVIVATTFYG